MEYRKLISFGKSSFVISLPKSWIVQNKVKKGDLIYLEENGPNLLLSRSESVKNNEEKKITINVDGKSLLLITREVNSAYILNNRIITLKGKEIKNNIKELQSVIQNLIALEIMEQSSDSITAKDFLNMKKVSVDELIRKMDVVTKTMLNECKDIFIEDNYKNTNERDKDVNRLYFLLYRIVLYNIENPMNALKEFKLTSIDFLKYLYVGFYIEGIADEARRTARFLRLLKISSADKDKLVGILSEIIQQYFDTMKFIYNKDSENVLKLSELKKIFNDKLDELEKSNPEIKYYCTIIHRIRRMISYIHGLGRVSYTVGNY